MTYFRPSFVSLVLAASCLLVTAACSSSSDGGSNSNGSSGSSGSSGSKTVSSSDCVSRCSDKIVPCGANQDQAKTDCSSLICKTSISEDRISCFEKKSCDDIANAKDFDSLCPASGNGSGGGGTSQPTKPEAATCNSATCAAGQYCAMAYDSQTDAWKESSCQAMPSDCANESIQNLCPCMEEHHCPSGSYSLKCSQADSALYFGCE